MVELVGSTWMLTCHLQPDHQLLCRRLRKGLQILWKCKTPDPSLSPEHVFNVVTITDSSTRQCDSQCYRNVYIEGTTAYDGGEVCGINYNYGDTCTLNNVCTDASHPCVLYDGCDDDCEPEKIGYCSG